MTFVLRAARTDDLAALYQMASTTGGGLTSLPPDSLTLQAKLQRAAAAFARPEDTPSDELFLFVLEDMASGEVMGTCQIVARVGSTWPFYSYRIDSFTKYSKELGRTIEAEILTLSTDLGGCTEVGGLFLRPGERASGAGSLLARSRYLFIRAHRGRFADCTIAELRGVHDDLGGSPFWDGIAGRFFDMSFREADEFNAMKGNQFIADLMPKHPIYTALLPQEVRAVIGVAHRSGGAALRMLEKEGFVRSNHIDIFDGGPAMTAATDALTTIRNAADGTVIAIGEVEAGEDCLIACGRLGDFRACHGQIRSAPNGVTLDPVTAAALAVRVGDRVTYAPR